MRLLSAPIGLLFAGFVAVTAAPATAAETYPSRPIRLVVPFGAGGVADISSRIVAEKLGDQLGQRFVIDNQPGAGGIAAGRSVLSAPHDGYTFGAVYQRDGNQRIALQLAV